MQHVEIIDWALLLAGILFLYKTIKKTEFFHIYIVLVFVFLLGLTANLIGLQHVGYVLNKLFEISILGLVVVFHQEIRIFLNKLNRLTKFQVEKKDVIKEIEEAVFSMSKKKTGALIVFDPDEKIALQMENMVPVNASVTKELLETIFFKNTPLHDGAVLIQDGKITYAGCKLPLKAKKREEYGNLGTRHLAAIEVAETFGVVAIVVSEETGSITIATRGMKKINSREEFRTFFKKRAENEMKMREESDRIEG